MSNATDLVNDFADFVVNARYEDLPEDAVDAAKKSILDTLGVCLGASGKEPAVRGFIELVQETGGRAESSILGFGSRVPAASAAFANGTLAHALDYDDQTPWGAHPDSSAVTATFAVAERRGGISGRQLITAIALAQDMFIRLRCNVGWRQDWNLAQVLGVFCATGASAHVLGLRHNQTVNAFGLASMQCCGTMEAIFGLGSDLRGLYAGFTAKGAVLAALLAEKGVSGIATLFEGKTGIFNVYFDGKYDREKILHGLGKDYSGGAMVYKYWPAVGNVHTYIHATMELMKEENLVASDIAEIRAYVGDFAQRMAYPLDVRRAPATLLDAKFSVPFCIALAAVRGRLKLADFGPDMLTDPAILAFARRVVPIDDSSLNWNMKMPDGRVQIVMKDGRSFERIGHHVPGSPDAPMTWDQLNEKFSDCASCAAIPLASEKIARAQDMARNLESLTDATKLIGVLA
jgi:2-methylcitrate dehydratase PrpD